MPKNHCLTIWSVSLILLFSTLAGQAQHAHGTGHDMQRMPGLMGKNASPEESRELAVLFRNFRTLHRTVEMLPNGIRTITRSTDKEVMDVLVSHVVGMIDRVERGDDPEIRIQSPTLDIFFERYEDIDTLVDLAVNGIVVVQTSDDPEIVAALHEHANEVSAMVEQGMHAVHMMMMKRRQSH